MPTVNYLPVHLFVGLSPSVQLFNLPSARQRDNGVPDVFEEGPLPHHIDPFPPRRAPLPPFSSGAPLSDAMPRAQKRPPPPMIPLERRVSHRAARCRPRPVRIHQKMRVVPPSEAGDSVSQDMLDGSAASKRRKFDLPTPLIESVDDYTDGIRPDFKTPATYIRHRPREAEAMREKVLFTLSPDDRAWIAERAAQTGKAALLTPDLFEKMIVLMEHRAFERGATAAEKEHDSACLSQADAEELFFSELHFVGAASQKLIADVRAAGSRRVRSTESRS